MTSDTDQRAAARAVVAGLTGPAGPFELVPEDVLGTTIQVFRNRQRALHDLLADSLRHGDREYIVTEDSRQTFSAHVRAVASLAQSLREQYGVGKGDRVAITGANSAEWIATFWATVSIGAIAVGFNAWWSPRELEYGLDHSAPTLVVADAKRAANLPESSTVPVLRMEEDIGRLCAAHPGAPLPSADVAEDDPAMIVYTSGTSGRPKGAVHSHRNLLAVVEYHRLNDALMTAFGDPTDPRDRVHLLVLPLFHIASLHNLAVPRLATGSKIALYQGAFDADRVLSLVERERVTNWGAVPTMAVRLLEHGNIGKYDTSSLTAFALASAPSSVKLKDRIRDNLPFATSLVDSYGLTETCTSLTVATPLDLAEAPGTLGWPTIGVELEIRDAHGQALPEGSEGEVCARSTYNMLGYWRDDAATADTIRADRWLHTGDLGVIEDGRLRLSSRRSDLIIRGGENVYPAEIEGHLTEHPDVIESAVIGVASEEFGHEVAAVVVTRPGSGVTIEELKAYAADGLAYFKVPSRWRLTEENLPRNATGKVIRPLIRL